MVARQFRVLEAWSSNLHTSTIKQKALRSECFLLYRSVAAKTPLFAQAKMECAQHAVAVASSLAQGAGGGTERSGVISTLLYQKHSIGQVLIRTFTVGATNGRPQTTAKPKRATNGRPYKQISAEMLFSLPICVIMRLTKSLPCVTAQAGISCPPGNSPSGRWQPKADGGIAI